MPSMSESFYFLFWGIKQVAVPVFVVLGFVLFQRTGTTSSRWLLSGFALMLVGQIVSLLSSFMVPDTSPVTGIPSYHLASNGLFSLGLIGAVVGFGMLVFKETRRGG